MFHIGEAILEVLSEEPEGLRPEHISKAIGIRKYTEERFNQSYAIVNAVLIKLAEEGYVERFISCTGAKDKTPELLPAIMKYKGPLYPTLHKAMRENRFPKSLDILIVSAKYGLLESDEPIEDYDQRIDAERARELRSSVQKKLEAFLDGKDYDQLFNGLWKAYQAVLEGFDLEKHFDTVIPVETNRGKKMSQLKAWIIDLFEFEIEGVDDSL